MSSLSQRTRGAATADSPARELREVELTTIDGARVRGILHCAHGTRTIDFLNHQAEGFVAMTEAELIQKGRSEQVAFVAINKAHIVRLIESTNGD